MRVSTMFRMVAKVAVIALVLNMAPTIYAQEGHPAAKATAKVSNIALITAEDLDEDGNLDWTTILSNTIKTANQKDLFIDVSLEVGLYTDTLVRSKGGNKDTSTAEATVEVQVLVDGVPAEPGEVVFGRRMQELSAIFQGLLFDEDGNLCLSIDPDTGAIVLDEECLQPEELELILDTQDAASFNFVAEDLLSGVHTIEVQARIDTSVEFQTGNAEAKATVGKGSVTIEEVRMIKGEDVLVEL